MYKYIHTYINIPSLSFEAIEAPGPTRQVGYSNRCDGLGLFPPACGGSGA